MESLSAFERLAIVDKNIAEWGSKLKQTEEELAALEKKRSEDIARGKDGFGYQERLMQHAKDRFNQSMVKEKYLRKRNVLTAELKPMVEYLRQQTPSADAGADKVVQQPNDDLEQVAKKLSERAKELADISEKLKSQHKPLQAGKIDVLKVMREAGLDTRRGQ